MPSATNPLFQPFDLKGLKLANRAVLAPMTRNRAHGTGDVQTAMNATYYAQRASGGLLITEATQVSPEGKGYVMTPGIYSPQQIEGWKAVTRAVHEKGGKIFLQLWHVGRISHPDFQPAGQLPVAPSAIRPQGHAYTPQGKKDFVTPRALGIEELPGIAGAYAQGAKNAIAAGFDGVEIHGANGYLFDQFLRDKSNQRKDRYGGSIENRLRFPLEIVDAVTGAVSAQRLGLRLSPLSSYNDMADSNPKALFYPLVEELSRRGLAYVHMIEEDGFGAAKEFDFKKIRRHFQGPWMVNGGYDLARANQAIQAGDADLVSFGAIFLANPDLVERFKQGAPLNEPDPSSFYGGTEKGYIDYPAL